MSVSLKKNSCHICKLICFSLTGCLSFHVGSCQFAEEKFFFFKKKRKYMYLNLDFHIDSCIELLLISAKVYKDIIILKYGFRIEIEVNNYFWERILLCIRKINNLTIFLCIQLDKWYKDKRKKFCNFYTPRMSSIFIEVIKCLLRQIIVWYACY